MEENLGIIQTQFYNSKLSTNYICYVAVVKVQRTSKRECCLFSRFALKDCIEPRERGINICVQLLRKLMKTKHRPLKPKRGFKGQM